MWDNFLDLVTSIPKSLAEEHPHPINKEQHEIADASLSSSLLDFMRDFRIQAQVEVVAH